MIKATDSRWFQSPSGRAVLALGAILIIAVLAMTSYEIWRQRSDALANAERNLEALSLSLAEQTGRSLHSVELVLDATVRSMEQAGGIEAAGTEGFHRTLRERTTGIPVILGMAVIDAEGGMVNAARSFPPPPGSYSDRDYFRYHRDNDTDEVFVSKPARSPIDGKWVIPVTRRLSTAAGGFAGIVLAGVDPSYFEHYYSRVLPAEGGAFALFRADGLLLARSPSAGDAIGKDFSHLPVFRRSMPDHGLTWGPSPIDGNVRIVGYHRLNDFPLLINVSIDEATLLAAWRGNTVRLSLAAVLAVAVLMGAVTVLYRQLSLEETQALALRQSEERLRFAQFALDHAGDMVFWMDREGRILYANQAACARLGYGPEGLVGRRLADIDPSYANDRWPPALEELREKRHMRLESTHRTIDGRVYPVEISANFVDFGGAGFVCAFARDISERRAAEAALADKTASLEASNAELEQFAYVASHDLREPLRMVNSFVTMLARRCSDKLDDEGREYIGFAQEGAVRMDRLILDLLEYSRVGRIERPFTAIPLARAADLATRGLGLAAHEAGADVVLQADMPTVLGNEEELVRLYLNLVGNAIKYRHPDRKPEIRLGAELRDREVTCWVTDNGIGIAPQYFERIFRIFQRLHVREKYEGTGIGLAICKKIVEHHGGRIWIESVPDHGTTFWFTLKPA